MAKLIKKSKCEFESGCIIKNNEQVGIPYQVWLQLNMLETVVQQYDYLRTQPEYQPGPSLNGFERKSGLSSGRPYVDAPETPVTDKRVEEAIAFMEEVDAVSDANEINKYIDRYGDLIDWLAVDKFIEGDCYMPIDTFVLGNPLELKADDVVATLTQIVKHPVVME